MLCAHSCKLAHAACLIQCLLPWIPKSWLCVDGLDHVQNATEELERLGYAFDAVKKQLLGRLHELARKQIGFDAAPASSPPQNGVHTNGSNGSASVTGMPEVANAVQTTFIDQPDETAVHQE